MSSYDGLTPWTGATTTGLRGNVGGENARWAINPKTGKEVPIIAGKNGSDYLLSDLLQKYGSMDAVMAAGAPAPRSPEWYAIADNPATADDPTGNAYNGDFGTSIGLFNARPSNDTFSGKDGLRDLESIALMAGGAAFGGAFGAEAGAGAGEAAAGAGAAGADIAEAGAGGAGVAEGAGSAAPTVLSEGGAGGTALDAGATTMPPAVLDTGGAAMMSAAVPEAASTISGWGLSETAPGVFEAAAGGHSLSSILGSVKDVASVASPVLSGAAALTNAQAAKSIGKTPPPGVRPLPQMPTAGSQISLTNQSTTEQVLRRRGRASTVLTDSDSDKLGGGR